MSLMLGYGRLISVSSLILPQARVQPIQLTSLTLSRMQSKVFIYDEDRKGSCILQRKIWVGDEGALNRLRTGGRQYPVHLCQLTHSGHIEDD